MNDATLPSSRPSSSSAESQSSDLSDSKSKGHDVCTSQNHSQELVMNGATPEADNGKLARQKSQKRKRTRYVCSDIEALHLPLKLNDFIGI